MSNIAGGSRSSLERALRHLPSNSDRRAGTGKVQQGLVEALSAACWSLFARTRAQTSMTNLSIVDNALKQSLCYHLERTSRYVVSSAGIWSSTEFGARKQGAKLLALLDRYPGLALLWETQLRGWSGFVSAFLDHATAFLKSRDLQLSIAEIETDFSDPHWNGRSVIRVRLSDNSQWYYKPRSGRQEAAWGRFVDAVNSAGFVPSLRAANVQVCRGHCWMPSIPARLYRNAQERAKLAQRVGALLYLAHIFRAVDLHAGNVVTWGEYPVFVDCESFFHPETRLPVNREGETSLSRTGMFVSSSQNAGWPLAVTKPWEKPGPKRSRKEVIRGFEAMHEFLQSQKHNRLLKAARDRLQRLPVRRIYRPTTYYFRLLQDSLASRMLSEPNRRYRFLHAQLNDGLCSVRTVQSEILQLLAGDIPIFCGSSAPPRRALTEPQFLRVLREIQAS